MGAPGELVGAAAVAGTFSGRAMGAQPALIDGTTGIVWAPGGQAKVVWEVTIVNNTITDIYMIAASETLDELDLVMLEN
jgi:RNA polymerase sigma-70 factor (ECF subfamily)